MFCAPRTMACVWLLLSTAAAAETKPVEVTVHCDRRDNLGTVLRALEDKPPGPVTVRIFGTCIGPIEIVRDHLTLRGESRDTAAIEGAAAGGGALRAAVVASHGVRDLRLENLRISDGPVGVRVTYAEVTIESCDLARTDTGVESHDSEMAVLRTTVRDARNAIDVRRSRVDVSFSTIRDISDEGISATEFSRLVLLRTEVVSGGLSVGNSTLVATHCDLQGPIHARTYSRISLAGSSGSTAMLRGNISASNSEVFLFRVPVDGAVKVGESGRLTAIEAELSQLRLADGADASITSGRIAGDVVVEGFSTVQLTSSFVAGALVCLRGADAMCKRTTTASTSGCRSCEGAPGP